jgi:mannitol/fructose-specific phosphotransferase system IIA component (Ntr-type)
MSSHFLAAERAISLADFTSADLIVPELRGRDVATVIRELCAVLQREAGMPDLLPFYHAALNREFLIGTALNCGLAIPHARVSGLARLTFALGRSAEPLVWLPKDRPPVRLVFLCAVPATEATAYLLLTSGLARLAKERECLATLLDASETSVMWDALRQIKLRPAPREAR